MSRWRCGGHTEAAQFRQSHDTAEAYQRLFPMAMEELAWERSLSATSSAPTRTW